MAMKFYKVYDDSDEEAKFVYFTSKNKAISEAKKLHKEVKDSLAEVTEVIISPRLSGKKLILAILNEKGYVSEHNHIYP